MDLVVKQARQKIRRKHAQSLKGSLPPALSLEIKEWKESDQMNSEWMPFACTT